ncbi:MAG: adenylate/guanylate cyclase domain-containing protein [Rhodocyclaceae bacterium]|jgi:adenylate cyclase|nr:adenylate/guanylate cyclase domain-containing protein [Rhodocyclaceae bacterium]
MNKTLSRVVLGLLVVAAMLGHAAQVYQIALINHLDSIIYDVKVRLTMPQSMDDRVVILDIDERSLAAEGRWPWSRNKLEALLDKLFDHYQIGVLGFDVVFAEPDRSSGIDSLEAMAKSAFRDDPKFQSVLRGMRPKLDYDARFSRAMKGRKVVLGYYFSGVEDGVSTGALPPPAFPGFVFQGRNIAFTTWSSFGSNLQVFQQSAAAAGHFNPLIDFDGLARRIPMLAEYQGNLYESLSLAVVRVLLDIPEVTPGFTDDVSADYAGLEWLDLKKEGRATLRIPVDANVATLIPYRGYRGSFAYHSMTDVLSGAVPKEKLEGRIVLVGTTAPGLMDLRATPVDTAYPGVEVHANLISGILDGTIKYKPAYILGADVVLLFLVGVLMAVVIPRLAPFKATVLGLLVLFFLLSINFAFWYGSNVVLPLAASLSTVVLLYAINMAWGYFVESRTKKQFAQLFGQYVPPELVDEMARNPEGYSMDGRRADLTVLFSDVRGFTTISEALQPDQLAALMNEYLGAMTEVVREHRGTLDKYIGDAIMAFWGAPVADGQHARNATLTALGMQAALKELNRDLLAKGWPELKIGVGVNSGPMTVGDMGSPVRKAYTVMGDAVNLGARLEGITKQYGVGILVGEETHQLIADQFIFRELDRVRVKGKTEPVAIYEPLGEVGAVNEAELKRLQRWNEALALYRSQAWDGAQEALTTLQEQSPHYVYELYLQRIAHLRNDPPGPNWDGVTTFETK